MKPTRWLSIGLVSILILSAGAGGETPSTSPSTASSTFEEDFADLKAWKQVPLDNSIPDVSMVARTDGDPPRSVACLSNPAVGVELQRRDGVPTIDLNAAELNLDVTFRFTGTAEDPQNDYFWLSLCNGNEKVPAGQISRVTLFIFQNGRFEARVYKSNDESDRGKDTETTSIVRQPGDAPDQNAPLGSTYVTIKITRATDGNWTVTRSDTGKAIGTAHEPDAKIGGTFNSLILRDAGMEKTTAPIHFFDSIRIQSGK